MMNAMQDTTFSANLPSTNSNSPQPLPPYSPVKYEPPVKLPYPFDTNFSRDPAHIRDVYETLVEKTKEMNLGKPEVSSGRKRARNLGLSVNIDQAKGLHWRSIQARHPVTLTNSPTSPPRTPRRPATEYPSAEQCVCMPYSFIFGSNVP